MSNTPAKQPSKSLAAMAAAAKARKDGNAPVKKTGGVPPYPLVPTPPKMDDKQVKELVTKVGGFRVVNSLKVENGNSLVKMTYGTTSLGASSWVRTTTYDEFKNSSDFENIFHEINNTIATNNTVISVLKRLAERTPKREHVVDPTRYANSMPRLLPVSDLLKSGVQFTKDTKVEYDNETIMDFVETADAGCPYMARGDLKKMKCNEENVEEAMSIAKVIASAMEAKDALQNPQSKLRLLMKQKPLWFTFRLKRKFERIERADWDKKVRPYYVVPFHLKILYKWVAYYVLLAHPNFVETQDTPNPSSSAYRFSWAHGGANKIMNFLLPNNKATPTHIRLTSVCFGDDNLYNFTFSCGTVVAWAPDFVSMDLRNPRVSGSLMVANFNRANPVFAQNVLFQNILRLMCHHAYQHLVHVHGSVFVAKSWSLVSGICATTFFNIYASGMARIEAEVVLKKYNVGAGKGESTKFSEALMESIKKDIVEAVARRLGMTVKPETMPHQVIDQKKPRLGLPFLGFAIMEADITDGVYKSEHPSGLNFIPIPRNEFKCFSALAIPGSMPGKTSVTVDGKEVERKAREIDLVYARAYGLYVSGYCFTRFGPFLRKVCETLKTSKAQAGATEDLNETCMSKDDASSLIALSPIPPTSVDMQKLYINPEAFFGEKDWSDSKEEVPVSAVPDVAHPSNHAEFDMDFNLDELVITDEDPHLTIADSGVTSVPVSKVGQKLPNPAKTNAQFTQKTNKRSGVVGVRLKKGQRPVSAPAIEDDEDVSDVEDEVSEGKLQAASIQDELARELEMQKAENARMHEQMARLIRQEEERLRREEAEDSIGLDDLPDDDSNDYDIGDSNLSSFVYGAGKGRDG